MQIPLNRVAMLASVALLVAAWWLEEALPAPRELRAELHQDPEQVRSDAPPFQTTVGGVTYTVKPLYRYELWGLVVSRHDASAWWDWIHKASHDNLNVADLCVVFGENVRSGAYAGLSYSNGQWTCNFSTRSDAAWTRFSLAAISNNHLLADRASMARRIRGVRVGDQVHIAGYLAEYSHDHGFAFHRGTSTTRTDTGNGACETVYVESLRVLKAGGGIWRMLWWLGLAGCVASIVVWLRAPYRPRD